MRKFLKVSAIVVGAFVIIAGIWTVDNLIYPFKSETPNYSDVERAFNKLKVPSDWQEVSSSENRGLYGRGCSPLNDSGCFSKTKTFKISQETSVDSVTMILIEAGCSGVKSEDISANNDPLESTSYDCGIGSGINFAIDILGPESEAYVVAKTY